MSRMLADARAETAALLQLRQQLALDRAQRDEPSRLTLVLLALVALFAALAAWLAWRLRKQARATPARVDWWQHSAAVPMDAPADETPAAQFEPSRGQRRARCSACRRRPRHGQTRSTRAAVTSIC